MLKKDKIIQKIGTVICLAAVIGTSLSAFVGCGDKNGAEEIDSKRTQLYISNFDGGIGTQWLDNIEKLFEEEYKDVWKKD